MMSTSSLNPYQGNILVDGLGPILSPPDVVEALTHLPPLPPSMDGVPVHVRTHLLLDVLDLHLPPLIERRLQHSVDLMIRRTLNNRAPQRAETWSFISGEAQRRGVSPPAAMAACVEGISGVGKTQGCQRCLSLYREQVIKHDTFPGLVGSHQQVVYQSIEVPPSGTATDLARALMLAWSETTGSSRFHKQVTLEKLHGQQALMQWRQVAGSHFLALLHLDEVQNFFKLSTLEQRRARRQGAEPPELSIVEDLTLRWLMSLTNSGQIALLLSGTPDGIGALTKRLGILARVNTGGYHAFERLALDVELQGKSSSFLAVLSLYQYVRNPIAMNDKLIRLIFQLTAGVQRIVIALWIAAHRVAFERKADNLCMEDFAVAARTWLAPLQNAVAALNSGDAVKMARFEDLIPRDTAFWTNFWSSATS